MEIRDPKHKITYVGLYFDHINVHICINLFSKYLQENTQRNTAFSTVYFSYY